MRPLRLLVDFLTYEGTPPTNNPIDETRSHRKVEEQDVSETSRVQRKILAAASNISIPLADSAVDYLVIYSDQQISINLNGDSTAMVLTPQLAGKMCPVFVMRGTITSLAVSNALAVDANIDVRSVKV